MEKRLNKKTLSFTIFWMLFFVSSSIIAINELFTMEWNLTILELLTFGAAIVAIILNKSYNITKVQLTFASLIIGVYLILICVRFVS